MRLYLLIILLAVIQTTYHLEYNKTELNKNWNMKILKGPPQG